ncbi:Putative methyltransferase C9orf114 homolog [Geodia barretti]|uniref:Methyltransferase C9orf114 homolog n=1 Tax=Geodia barretti TaxID=519541 RepID=A0AA35TWQ4_GEOBA|nr:Putative methyltransferase C9orf114 homolog [Geodia barretti]
MKRRKGGERVQELEKQEVHVAPHEKAKKTKRKRADTETEVELPCELDDTPDPGSLATESATPGEKKMKKKKKKKKREAKSEEEEETLATDNNSRSEAEISGSRRGRGFTVSIALPGSIVDNAQTLELKTYLAGQIARAAVIFCIDEIVVFNERGKQSSVSAGAQGQGSDPNVFLARLLEYQETPQYLRKALFPMHRDLKYAGLLNPLDCPHHMRADDVCPYREGIVVGDAQNQGEVAVGSLVDCGLKKNVVIDKELDVGISSVVFGGLKGLEHALDCDDTLTMADVGVLFHHYLNTCPAQGSRTIRTEEAILISLAALRPLIKAQTTS